MRTVDAVVIGAMDEEVRPFERRASEIDETQERGRARMRLATVGTSTVLVVRSGIGIVNAAAGAVAAITAVQPSAIFSTGSAGGLGDTVSVGSVVAGNTYTYTGADARAFDYAIGQVPGMPELYPAEPTLLERAGALDGVVVGQMVSGDTFVDADRLGPLQANFPHAVATDMESTAIAQVAHSYRVPFLSVRGISDMCGPAASADHALSLDEVSERAAAVVLAVLSS